MSFHRLVAKNSFDYWTYTFCGQALDEKAGGTCQVRWPDGSITAEKFIALKQATPAERPGWQVGVCYVLVLEFTHRGLAVQIPMVSLDLADVRQGE